jgi:hypothetical protein
VFSRLHAIAGHYVRVRVKLPDGYSHLMPSMSRNTAEEMDEALR